MIPDQPGGWPADDSAAGSHAVQFYESEDRLAEGVAEFIGEGLTAGEPGIVIATAPHRQLFIRHLEGRGCDVEAALGSGRLTMLDAQETLEKLIVGPMPDGDLFKRVIGGAIESITRSGRGVVKARAFGEMVDLLWQAGDHQAALCVEEMWNELRHLYPFELLCAYSMGGFVKAPSSDLHGVCDQHVRVVPPSGSAREGSPSDEEDARLRSLMVEVGHRMDVERALRNCVRDLRRAEQRERARAQRNARLQFATSRLAAALSETDVASALLSVTEDVLEASAGVVYLRDADGELHLRAARGVPGVERWRVLPRQAPIPLVTAVADRYPVLLGTRRALLDQYPNLAFTDTPASRLQAVAALPLVHGSRVVGGFAVSFDGERAFDDEERRWFDGIAAQAALAADRARLYEAERRSREEAETLFRATREAEELQRRVADELRETVHLNELFVGVLAHDLRSPLAAIVTAGELVKARETDGRNEKALGRILTSGYRMTRMIEQLLDFTRLRLGGGLTLDPREADMGSLVRQAVDELDGAKTGVAIHVEQAGDTGGRWDVDRLGQVFSNLVANAVQHGSPEHGVRVLIDGQATETVAVRVHNRGAIPAELVPRVFDPLIGGDRRRDKSRGLGLGLFITKQIARAHGGDVTVESTEDRGTTFTLSLPRRPDVAAVSLKTAAPQPESKSSGPTLHPDREPGWGKLPESEVRFRLLVEAVKDYAIFMLDPTGHVMTWNAGAKRIKGYEADEIIGQHFSRFYSEEEARSGHCEEELEIAAREGRFEDEGWRIRKDGSKFWANVVITALRNPDGQLVGFAKVTRDLTERRRLHEEQIRAARAEEAIRLRDEFLSLASHELKTPLTVLQMQLETLHDRLDASDQKITLKLQRAAKSGERLAGLVESLLDVSRIATGKFVLEPEEMDLTDCLSSLLDGLRPTAHKAGCEISFVAEGTCVGTWDRLRLEQAVTNLVSNAIKYGARAPIDVSLRRADDGVVIEVRDHGPGIAAADLARIFGRFERAASMRNYGGLGLGLYLIQEIVVAHGGAVTAHNAPGGGACFQIQLPLRPVVASASSEQKPHEADVN